MLLSDIILTAHIVYVIVTMITLLHMYLHRKQKESFNLLYKYRMPVPS